MYRKFLAGHPLSEVAITVADNFLRRGPYRFYLYSHEPQEPLYSVHVDRNRGSCASVASGQFALLFQVLAFGPWNCVILQE